MFYDSSINIELRQRRALSLNISHALYFCGISMFLWSPPTWKNLQIPLSRNYVLSCTEGYHRHDILKDCFSKYIWKQAPLTLPSAIRHKTQKHPTEVSGHLSDCFFEQVAVWTRNLSRAMLCGSQSSASQTVATRPGVKTAGYPPNTCCCFPPHFFRSSVTWVLGATFAYVLYFSVPDCLAHLVTLQIQYTNTHTCVGVEHAFCRRRYMHPLQVAAFSSRVQVRTCGLVYTVNMRASLGTFYSVVFSG